MVRDTICPECSEAPSRCKCAGGYYMNPPPLSDTKSKGDAHQPNATTEKTGQPAGEGEVEFKNFHRLLCERFDYVHDEQDWKRDQLSLIEWIAKRASPAVPAQPDLAQRSPQQTVSTTPSVLGSVAESKDGGDNVR